LFEFEHGHIV